jgi:hypothetical protein
MQPFDCCMTFRYVSFEGWEMSKERAGMEKHSKPMTVAEIDEAIKALQQERDARLKQELEPLKAEIASAFVALLKKAERARALQKDYLPPWKEKKLMMDFEAD